MATEKTQTGLAGWWNHFAGNHPKAAKWIREGGLFVIVSNLVTLLKYFILQFLPLAFQSLSNVDFGWPGIPVTLFGETFQRNIFGYDAADGGLCYFCAYMISMAIRYIVAFVVINCIVNSINCVWVAVAGMFVPDFIYNIGTVVLNGGISMVIFFFVNKVIFPEAKQA